MSRRVDRDAMHAELRARYGDTITRAQMEEYRRETGKFPGWFYTEPFGSQHKISRGLYRIPAATSGGIAPVETGRKFAKDRRQTAVERPKKGVRPVLANPFDDDEDADVLVPTKRRGRTSAADDAVPPSPVVFIHAWVCPAKQRHPHRAPTESAPQFCDCGTQMIRHYWSQRAS